VILAPEQYIMEGKNAVIGTRLSSHRFARHLVEPQLHAMAYSLRITCTRWCRWQRNATG
jgi:hypothetical protein